MFSEFYTRLDLALANYLASAIVIARRRRRSIKVFEIKKLYVSCLLYPYVHILYQYVVLVNYTAVRFNACIQYVHKYTLLYIEAYKL